jgi:hypothetical protein
MNAIIGRTDLNAIFLLTYVDTGMMPSALEEVMTGAVVAELEETSE